jgi:hypothetical protein
MFENVPNYLAVKDEDANLLYSTIVETEAAKDIFDKACRDANCPPHAMAVILNAYMGYLRRHKQEWLKVLVGYVGEEHASRYLKFYRFDPVKKVIFLKEIEGCKLCQGSKSN